MDDTRSHDCDGVVALLCHLRLSELQKQNNDLQGLQLKILDKISEIYDIHNVVVLHDNFLIFMEYQD